MNKWSVSDWEPYSEGVEYSPSKHLYWANNQIYDQLSAIHNGIIGAGAKFKRVIDDINRREPDVKLSR